MQVILNDYQWDFFASTARFPGAVCGWGTGKTMLGIQKIALLCSVYKDNLGMIVRKVFKDLEQSTIQDWNLITGVKVKKQAREAVFPNGSRVYFRHLDELAGVSGQKLIQNVNLGCFYIEQGEELETGEQFDALRGRLRRKLELDEDYFADLAAFDQKAAESSTCLQCNSPHIAEEGDIVSCECGFRWPRVRNPRYAALLDYIQRNHKVGDRDVFGLRQGLVIANANGKNWIWKRWIAGKNPEMPVVQATTFDNAHNLPADFVQDMRSLEHGTEAERRKFRRFVMNCHDEMDLEGAYWLNAIQEARKEGRIGSYKPDPSVATHTVWDLGVGDSTAIWWVQKVNHEIRLVNYFEDNCAGIEHYVRKLEAERKRLGLHYGQHFWPHDGKNRDFSTGKERTKTALEMGLRITLLAREKKLEDGIERGRKLLPYCTFDETNCELGIACLEHYQRRKNLKMSTEDKPVFADAPLENDAIHGADAFRYVSAAVRKLGGGMTVEQVRELQAQYA